MRDRLLKQIAPLAKQLGEALVALLVPQLEHIRDRAIEDAKAKLRADLEALTEPPKPAPAKPIAKRRKKRKPTVSAVKRAAAPSKIPASSSSSRAPVPTRAAPSPRSAAPEGIRKCSNCGQPGHYKRTCPKASDAAPAKPSTHVARPVDPPPPRLNSTERAALAKPCRDPNCRIVRLHAAHGEDA